MEVLDQLVREEVNEALAATSAHVKARLHSRLRKVVSEVLELAVVAAVDYQQSPLNPGQDGENIIFFVDFGTFCDFDISEAILRQLQRTELCAGGRLIKYVTSGRRVVENTEGCVVETIHFDFQGELMPELVTMADLEQVLAKCFASVESLVSEGDTSKLRSLITLTTAFRSAISRIEQIVKSFPPEKVSCIVYHYGLLEPFYHLLNHYAGVPTFLLFYTPSYPNRNVPWVFDGLMKDVVLYQKSPETMARTRTYTTVCVESHLRYFLLMGLARSPTNVVSALSMYVTLQLIKVVEGFIYSNPDITAVTESILKLSLNNFLQYVFDTYLDWGLPPNVRIVNCWDEVVIPIPLSPLPSLRGYVSPPLGSCFIVRNQDEIHDQTVSSFLDLRGTRFIFLTLGSFEPPYFRLLVYTLFNLVTGSPGTYTVLVHDQKDSLKTRGDTAPNVLSAFSNHPHFLVVTGFLPYYRVVVRADVIITSGSYCIANTCMSEGKPLIYCPILNEQFFWAKNYQHQTGVPYLDIRSYRRRKDRELLAVQLSDALKAVQTKDCLNFLKNTKKKIKSDNGRVAQYIVETSEILKEQLRTAAQEEGVEEEEAEQEWDTPIGRWIALVAGVPDDFHQIAAGKRRTRRHAVVYDREAAS